RRRLRASLASCQRVPSTHAREAMARAFRATGISEQSWVERHRYAACEEGCAAMKFLILASVVTALFACGCEAQPAAQTPAAVEAQSPDMTRDLAVRMARSDAVARFGDG